MVEAKPGQEMRVLSVFPNMRARGVSMRVLAEGKLKGQTEAVILLDAPRFDYRWQSRLVYAEPLTVHAGLGVVVTGTFDNSDANPNNPDPMQAVRAGAGAADESLMAVMEILVPVAPDSGQD